MAKHILPFNINSNFTSLTNVLNCNGEIYVFVLIFSIVYGKQLHNCFYTTGLSVIVNAESYESQGLLTPDSGLKIFISDQSGSAGEEIFIDFSTFITAAPGFLHSIGINQVKRSSSTSQPS